MAELFDRGALVSVKASGANVLVPVTSELDIEFSFKRTNRPEPDEGTIRMWNLGPSDTKALETAFALTTPEGRPLLQTALSLGYGGDLKQLLTGSILGLRTEISQGADRYTELEVSDGGNEIRGGLIETSLGPGVTPRQLLDLITNDAGLTTSKQAAAAFAAALPTAQVTTYTQGVVLSDTTQNALNRLMEDMGLRWWVRDGQLQLIKNVSFDLAVNLNFDTGLLDYQAEKSGEVRFRSLLNPEIFPGRQVVLSDADNRLVGNYLVGEAEYTGQTWGGPWEVSCIAERL